MKFYLAGKIGPNDWRHSIVLGLRDAIHGVRYDDHGHGQVRMALPDERFPPAIYYEPRPEDWQEGATN